MSYRQEHPIKATTNTALSIEASSDFGIGRPSVSKSEEGIYTLYTK